MSYRLSQLDDRRGVLPILDEIKTALERTGDRFCFKHTALRPDNMTLGKGFGAGNPPAALLAREEEVVRCFEPDDQCGTYNGNPLLVFVKPSHTERVMPTRPAFRKAPPSQIAIS